MDIYDVQDHIATLEKIGVDTAKSLAEMKAAEQRQHRITQIHRKAKESGSQGQQALFASLDLDDTDAVIAAVDRVAFMQNKEHAKNVDRLYEIASDRAEGDVIRAFKRSDFLRILRPVFDKLAARITKAAETIPYGVMSIGDAARLKHADMYGQLEEDAQHWEDIESLLGKLVREGVIRLEDKYYGIELMVEDSTAYRETLASSSAPMRIARAVVAGRPNLHKPIEPHIEHHATYGQARDSDGWKAYEATAAENAARTALGLV
ncbi:hypothetical protein [Microbacterium testaceum]|uniref:hypothetical protein n=1 Tax=Microbacterium testaceum TaxID=2033 RepID=UPI0022E6C501|nr:hypothetical protein [Microbacterium testaceum]